MYDTSQVIIFQNARNVHFSILRGHRFFVHFGLISGRETLSLAERDPTSARRDDAEERSLALIS